MKKRKTYVLLTVILTVLFGIILPLTIGVKNPSSIALTFSLVWVIYSSILLGYVFLVEGERNKSETRKEEDPFPPKLIQEWGTRTGIEMVIKTSRIPDEVIEEIFPKKLKM